MININPKDIFDLVDKLHVSDEEKAKIVNDFNKLASGVTENARDHEIEMQGTTQTWLQSNIRALLATFTVLGVLVMFFIDIDPSKLAMGISLATVVLSYYFGSAEKDLVTKDEMRHERKMKKMDRD